MGEKCDVAADFAVTFTEFGVCYTFNGDPEAVKFVDDTSRGLSLILNVEQYEHMRGPQNDAGVKVTGSLLLPLILLILCILLLYFPLCFTLSPAFFLFLCIKVTSFVRQGHLTSILLLPLYCFLLFNVLVQSSSP
jgi:hypothetical protein